MLKLTVNGKVHSIEDVDPSTPLLWVLRDRLNLVGTKYGCGIAQCGACTVLVDGQSVRSCTYSVVAAAERDHLEFLLEIVGEPRWLEQGDLWSLNTERAAAVIKLAADKAGWGREMPPGRALGLAFYFSHAGHVAEVSVKSNKKLTVHNVTVCKHWHQRLPDLTEARLPAWEEKTTIQLFLLYPLC